MALADEMEWQILLKSGHIREEFTRMRREIIRLTKERDDFKEEVDQLRTQVRFGARPQQPRETPQVAPRPAPTPRVIIAPEPVVQEPVEEKKDLDESAQRFSLLELD